MAKPSSIPANVYYGGQAVIEGVMIRGPEHIAVAVRHPEGHIVRHAERLSTAYTGRARRLPLVRGCVVLAETMTLGMRALSFSARIQEQADKGGDDAEFPQRVLWRSVLLAAAIVLAVFFAAPILLANLLETVDAHRVVIVGVEGVVRILLLLGYILLISRIPDVRRVFQYHGAEHMTIHAYEHGRTLDIANVREFPKEHTRCGTSFLLVVAVVALVLFFVFDLLIDEGVLVRTASRVALIVPVAGISYEILRLGARFEENPLMKALFLPNIALQGLTTKVPDDDQIEIALAAFAEVVEAAERLPLGELEAEVEALDMAPPLD